MSGADLRSARRRSVSAFALRGLCFFVLFSLPGLLHPISVSAEEKVSARLQTAKGPIEIRLFSEQTPVAVANFINLAERGYYDGMVFGRAIPDLLIQLSGKQQTDGLGYTFADEILGGLKHAGPGVVGMSNSGPDKNAGVFYITRRTAPWLDGKHTVFGQVVSGQPVVDSIVEGDKLYKVKIEGETAGLRQRQRAAIAEWNQVLDKRE